MSQGRNGPIDSSQGTVGLEGLWNPENTFNLIYDVVRQIPRSTVATYGQVAALAGNKRWARVVSFALHVNPDPGEEFPCYRVVNRRGEVSSALHLAAKIVR